MEGIINSLSADLGNKQMGFFYFLLIYLLLRYTLEKTNGLTYVVLGKGVNIDDLKISSEGNVVLKKKNDDVGFMIHTSDGKIYKRFFLEDVKKLLGL